jgi:hypothetical protein
MSLKCVLRFCSEPLGMRSGFEVLLSMRFSNMSPKCVLGFSSTLVGNLGIGDLAENAWL